MIIIVVFKYGYISIHYSKQVACNEFPGILYFTNDIFRIKNLEGKCIWLG